MATNFPQYLGENPAAAYQIPPELQAQLDEIQKRRAAPAAPAFTPEQVAQRRGENDQQYALGILGNMAADQGLNSAGGQVLKQALANRQAKITERGSTDPLSGQFTYDPDYLRQRDETAEGQVQNRIAQGRLNWDSQQQAEASRRFSAHQAALDRAANRQPEALVAVVDPITGKAKLLPRGQAVGMQPAPTASGGQPDADERKAAGWLAQSQLAFSQMESALNEDEKASKPSTKETLMGAIPGKLGETATYAAMSEPRQRFVAAASSFAEAALRAATGAGVQEAEARQKINELTPRWGEKAAAIADKRARMEMYISSLTSRAGRALPQATAAVIPQGAAGGTARNPMGAGRPQVAAPVGGKGWAAVREN
jgi:hypothetical protein